MVVSKRTRGDDWLMSPKYIPYGQHALDEEDIQSVIEVLRSNVITQGKMIERFGKDLSNYTGAKFGIPVSSGTAALHLAVKAIGIEPGDEVISCPMTFCATTNAVLYEGGIVKFVDIDPDTLNIDANLIEEKITSKTKAIIPIDFRGYPASLGEIRELADKHNLIVIEDGSHSIGSTYHYKEKKYKCGDGIHADLCTFSFHPVKHITTGEGGAVLTNDKELFRKIFLLKKHGIDRREEMFNENERIGSWIYDMEMLGYNYRITDFQCALGISQLKKIERNKKRRRDIVNYYNENLKQFDEFILPFEADDVNSNFHLYVLQIKKNNRFDRYDLYKYLQKMYYHPMIHYIPVHLLSYYKNKFGYKRGDFPVAEEYYDRTISLPLYPTLTDNEVEKVVEDISGFINNFTLINK